MKIAIFSHAAVVPANRELFQALGREHEVLMVAPESWRGSLIRDLTAGAGRGVVTYPVRFSGNGSLFFYRSRFSEVKAFRPDLIFVDEEPWSLVALQIYLAFPKVKKVFYTKQNLPKRLPPPFSWIQQKIFRASRGAFVISSEAEAVLRWKNYAGAAVALPHSLNEKNFQVYTRAERSVVRAAFGLPDLFLVGYFGRLSTEKGIADLREAMRLVLPRQPDVAFVLVGQGELRASLEAFAREFPRVFVVPALPHGEVHRLMAAMDMTVLPSRTTKTWKEQFGRVIIESAACGVPVLGSDSGEIPRVIERIGCGTSFAEGSVEGLAQSILRMKSDEAMFDTYAKRGAENSVALYSHGAVADQLSACLRQFKA